MSQTKKEHQHFKNSKYEAFSISLIGTNNLKQYSLIKSIWFIDDIINHWGFDFSEFIHPFYSTIFLDPFQYKTTHVYTGENQKGRKYMPLLINTI